MLYQISANMAAAVPGSQTRTIELSYTALPVVNGIWMHQKLSRHKADVWYAGA